MRRCRVCGCTDLQGCVQGDGTACYWVEWDLCSSCWDQFDYASTITAPAELIPPDGAEVRL